MISFTPMKPFFSKRTAWERSLNVFGKALQDLKENKIPFIDLTLSNPTTAGFRYLNQELLGTFKNPQNLIYDPNPRGLLKAREAVSEYYASKSITVSPEDIIITAGTSEAYSFLFHLLTDPGDAILAPEPSYPLVDYLTHLNDITAVRYPLSFLDPKWRIDFDLLKNQMADPRIRGFLTVNPNNPTGNFISAGEADSLKRLVEERGLPILSDEVFHDFSIVPGAYASFAGLKHGLQFTLSGISKILGLPQMKLSWIAVSGEKTLKEEALSRLEIISDTYLSCGTPVQNALPDLIKQRPSITTEILTRLKNNLSVLRNSLAGTPFRLREPEGGWNAVIECPGEKSDEEWALFWLEECRILLHPGYLFDFQEGSYLVASLLPEETVFREGVEKMRRKIS